MPDSSQDSTPHTPVVEEDTGRHAIEEFEEAATAVTADRQLTEQVRHELGFRERVRRHLAERAEDDAADDADDAE